MIINQLSSAVRIANRKLAADIVAAMYGDREMLIQEIALALDAASVSADVPTTRSWQTINPSYV
jgi:hypothetical protein